MARDRSFWLTTAAVVGVFVFALFVRTYWNIEAATPGSGTPEGTFILSESDAYFHRHSVERVQTEGWAHPIKEPLVNYPVGGVNPNPPLFTWWQAVWGSLLTPVFEADSTNHATACPANAQPSQATCVSTWWVSIFSPALFGALTVLIVIFIGREIWGWRAGLIAGFLLATMTAHIERSVLGFADHDAIVLFFITLCFLFFTKALNRASEHRWVEHWGDGASRSEGLRAYVRANQLSIAFAAMAGVALAGVGLSWKGYAYAAGIMMMYGVVQVLVNHWRQRDSTHVFTVVGMSLLVGVLLSLPYYANPGLGAVFDTMLPVVFILLAWVVLGIVFTAARDLPFVLVLPGAIVAGLLALLVAFFVAPSVAASLLAPLVYFKQTRLYTTIAEAHPADFNTVVFGTGFVGFFVAVFALPYLVWVNRKAWRPTYTFVAVWALVAIFMTHSAVRFMINATPIFALLGGWGIALLLGVLKYETISKSIRGFGGMTTASLKRSVNWLHVVGAVLLALMLVFPNVLLAVDAGMPSQYEDKLIRQQLASEGKPYTDAAAQDTFVGARFGAFGQGFISDYWRELFEWLSTQDTQLPEAQRPAFLSWWDYGHWALSLGRHPAVADNFQNGFQFSGNFIAAQNETHAVQLFIARIMDQARAGSVPKATFTGAFQQAGLSASEADATYAALLPQTPPGLAPCKPEGRPEGCSNYGYAPQLDLDKALASLKVIEAATGDRIRYFAVDVRLFPFDNPATPDIDFGSIFYAPIVLSEHDPDDYVQAIIQAQVPGERKSEFNQTEWAAIQKDVRKAANIRPESVKQLYKYKEPFFNSMFFRTYIGTPVNLGSVPVTSCEMPSVTFPVEGDSLPGLAMPGFCMEHFRLVYFAPQVRMLRFYPGAELQGQVTVDGKPLVGARVVAYDDAGDLLYTESAGLLTDDFKTRFKLLHGRDIGARDFDVPHDEATTDAQGNYRLLLPFSTTGQVSVRAFKDEAEVGNRSFAVSVEQAESGAVLDAALGAVASTSGTLNGRVYLDADEDLRFGGADTPLQNAKVTLDGDDSLQATTGADGQYTINNVPPGRHQVLATLRDHEMVQRLDQSAASVKPGGTATFDVRMALTKASVAGTVWRDTTTNGALDQGEGVLGVNVKAFPDLRVSPNTALAATGFSRDNGTLAFDASPGTYIVRGEWVNPADGQGYAFGSALAVARGADTAALNTTATRLVPATLATLNLTLDQGNATPGAGNALVQFIPTQGGLPAAERSAGNGTLSLRLVQGTYTVSARATGPDGATYTLAAQTLVVGATPATFEGRLTRSG